MFWLRGLTIVMGAALIGSVGGAAAIGWFADWRSWTPFDQRAVVALLMTTLLWTIPGSAGLTLAYYWLGERTVRRPWRYFTIASLGVGCGYLLMRPFGPGLAVNGAAFGSVAAIAWIVLHAFLDRPTRQA
jgi:hypothetical protein